VAYPNGYLYLTVHWETAGITGETRQFGLKFDTTAAASQALVDAAEARVATFWAGANSHISSEDRLIFCRLAAVGTDGLYVPGTIAFDKVITALPGGGGTPSARHPAQLASVCSLTTDFPRGRAHRGRIYMPPLIDTLQSDYQWPASASLARANLMSAMIDGLNTDLPGDLTVFSKLGTGAKHRVEGLAIGSRPDVQRRRARSQIEGYSIVTIT